MIGDWGSGDWGLGDWGSGIGDRGLGIGGWGARESRGLTGTRITANQHLSAKLPKKRPASGCVLISAD